MKILVTGGSGFIGGTLIAHLSRAGHQVIATSRDPNFTISGATTRQVGELGSNTDWTPALEGIEAVVHLAARVHVMADKAADPLAENRTINTDGTTRLAEQGAAAGVKHFIFLSTIKVHGEQTPATPFVAHDTPQPNDPYAIAKLEAEQALLEIAHGTDMRVHIIRPPLVYGPGVGGNFLSLLKLCTKGLPLPLASIDNRRSLIYVGNLVSLITCLLDQPQAPGRVYLCKDGEDISTPELLRRVAGTLGENLAIWRCPVLALRLAGVLLGKSAAISRLGGSLVVDDLQTRNDLNWTPPFSMIQGLQETADWFKSQP